MLELLLPLSLLLLIFILLDKKASRVSHPSFYGEIASAMSFSFDVYLLVLVILKLNFLQYKCIPSLSFTSHAHGISMARGILENLSSNPLVVTGGKEDPSTGPSPFIMTAPHPLML